MNTQGIPVTPPNITSAGAAVAKAATNSSQLPGGFMVLFLAMIMDSQDMTGQMKQLLLPRVLQEQKTDIFAKDISNCHNVNEVFEVCYNELKSNAPEMESFSKVIPELKEVTQSFANAYGAIIKLEQNTTLGRTSKELVNLRLLLGGMAKDMEALTKDFLNTFKGVLEGTSTFDPTNYASALSAMSHELSNIQGALERAMMSVRHDVPNPKQLAEVEITLIGFDKFAGGMQEKLSTLSTALQDLPTSLSGAGKLDETNNANRFAYGFVLENGATATGQLFFGHQVDPQTEGTQTQAFIDEANEVGSGSQRSLNMFKQGAQSLEQIMQEGMSIIDTDQSL